MAITTTKHDCRDGGWIYNAQTADGSGTETIVPAVANKSHYIRSITLNNINAITLTIQDNTGTPVKILGPIQLNDIASADLGGGSVYTVNYPAGLKVAAGKSIDLLADGSGAVSVVVQGDTLE
jgi:hypothetical protein